jgi:hypothetical protein
MSDTQSCWNSAYPSRSSSLKRLSDWIESFSLLKAECVAAMSRYLDPVEVNDAVDDNYKSAIGKSHQRRTSRHKKPNQNNNRPVKVRK